MMAVLHEEILKNACGTEEKAIQPTWLLTVASVGSIGVKAVENEGGDHPNSPCTSLSPARCASRSPHSTCISSYNSVCGWFASTTMSITFSPLLPISRPSFLRLEIKFLSFRHQFWVRKCLRECIRF